MRQIIVVGGGAAGMMAAIAAAGSGNHVILLEKNEKLGKKIYITGKGRCNLTNSCETEDLFFNVLHNPKFLYSAFYGFTNQDTVRFFEENGLSTKVERGQRVFPCSDHASDVIKALTQQLKDRSVEVRLHQEVSGLLFESTEGTDVKSEGTGGEFRKILKGVTLKNKEQVRGDAVILATGGLSYPSTGSTGDGYRFAADVGHFVTECAPSLVPFTAAESWVKELSGLSLKNVSITIEKDQKKLYEEFGEMLFTHFGVSGPLLLRASAIVNDYRKQFPLQLYIDLKPALSLQQLDARILRDFDENKNKTLQNALRKLFPARLIPVMIAQSGIPSDRKVHEITQEERLHFAEKIKRLPVTLTGFRDYNEAIITRGGVSTKEINPSTMESKLVKGLYFAGEVLDLDALTGGFNLQIAWSTGYAAGSACASKL